MFYFSRNTTIRSVLHLHIEKIPSSIPNYIGKYNIKNCLELQDFTFFYSSLNFI